MHLSEAIDLLEAETALGSSSDLIAGPAHTWIGRVLDELERRTPPLTEVVISRATTDTRVIVAKAGDPTQAYVVMSCTAMIDWESVMKRGRG